MYWQPIHYTQLNTHIDSEHHCNHLVLWMQAFFAEIYSEAQASQAAPGHHALAELHQVRLVAAYVC